MASLLVLCPATRPALVWLLFLLHLLVGMRTVILNLGNHPQQSWGQGEEELLLPEGERG